MRTRRDRYLLTNHRLPIENYENNGPPRQEDIETVTETTLQVRLINGEKYPLT